MGGGVPSVVIKKNSENLRIFVYHYVRSGNATLALQKTGCQSKGASLSSAAYKVLNKDFVQAAIKEEQARVEKETNNIDIVKIIRKNMDIANADVSQFYKDGIIKPMDEWPEDSMIAVERIIRDKDTGRMIDVIFTDRLRATDQINKIKGFYKELKIKLEADDLDKLAEALDESTEPEE